MDEIDPIPRTFMGGMLGAMHAAAALRYFSIAEQWPEELVEALPQIVTDESDHQDPSGGMTGSDQHLGQGVEQLNRAQADDLPRPGAPEPCPLLFTGGGPE